MMFSFSETYYMYIWRRFIVACRFMNVLTDFLSEPFLFKYPFFFEQIRFWQTAYVYRRVFHEYPICLYSVLFTTIFCGKFSSINKLYVICVMYILYVGIKKVLMEKWIRFYHICTCVNYMTESYVMQL